MPVAFVLSGGASLGASRAAMVQALYKHGVRPDLLVSTSGGVTNAAFIASRPPTPSTAADLRRVWRRLSLSDISGEPADSRPLATDRGAKDDIRCGERALEVSGSRLLET
jgi:predicted acylesterase/phospholipase RssA